MGTTTSKEDSIKKGWKVTGDTDKWCLVCKAVNLDTSEYHSTKALELADGSAVLQCDSVFLVGGVLTPMRVMLLIPSMPKE